MTAGEESSENPVSITKAKKENDCDSHVARMAMRINLKRNGGLPWWRSG